MVHNGSSKLFSLPTERLDVCVLGSVCHLAFSVSEMLALVHGETAGATTETVSLGSEFAAIALLAEQVTAVLGGIRRI